METANEDDMDTNVVVVTLNRELEEIQTEVCPISELDKHCNTGVSATVEDIPGENMDDNSKGNIDQNVDKVATCSNSLTISHTGVDAEVEIAEESMDDSTNCNIDQNMDKITNPCGNSLTICDAGVGAEVEITEESMDDSTKCNIDQNMDKMTNPCSNSLTTNDDNVMTTGHTYMVTKVTLTSDLESDTGAEDLDSLIQAVTNSRKSTTKETVKTSQGLTDTVMVT